MHQDKWLCCEKYQEKSIICYCLFSFLLVILIFDYFLCLFLWHCTLNFATTSPPPKLPQNKNWTSSNSHALPSYFIFSSAISRQTGGSGRSLGGTNLKTREKAFFLQYLERQRNLFPVSLQGFYQRILAKRKKRKRTKQEKEEKVRLSNNLLISIFHDQ